MLVEQFSKDSFYDESKTFIQNIFKELKIRNIDISNWPIDHLCYRVSSIKNYRKMKSHLDSIASLLVESPVNGRQISTYKLDSPIIYNDRIITLIELPAPKPGSNYQDGFEHLEVILPISFKCLMSKYGELKFKDKGLANDFNQELGLKLGELQVKFHHLSLESVVRLECNDVIFTNLQKLGILTLLKRFDPLIAGTFPLGLELVDSDIDIICQVSNDDLAKFSMILNTISKIPGVNNLQVYKEKVDELESTICHFVFEGLAYEVFAQDRPSVEQRAYKHYLVEENILRVRDKSFYIQVKNIRAKGIKTEPAFGQALKLENAYEDLLKMNTMSDVELLAL